MKKIILLSFVNLLFSNQFNFNLEKSYITYTVMHPFHTWDGTSKDFTVDIKNHNNQLIIFVSAQLNSFDSKNENRDSNMLFYTESLKYPYVTFISDTIKYKELSMIKSIEGNLNFHGMEKRVNIDMEIIENDLNLSGQCKFKIDLNEFNIELPKLLMLPINNIIDINSKIVIDK